MIEHLIKATFFRLGYFFGDCCGYLCHVSCE